MEARLETARLVLTPVTSPDVDELHALWTTPGVRRFLWDDEVIPLERTMAAVAESGRLFEAHRFGLWGARLHAARALVGFGGFWYFRDPPELELLYGVAAHRWNEGLATEMAGAVVDYGFEALGHQVIRASTDAGNRASVRVLEKLGFLAVRRAVAGDRDTVFHQLSRAARGRRTSR
jgi:RimJ/RimL family protein N-acetyltransferase